MTSLAVSLYILYILVSVAITIWVARTLHRGGRVFLVDAFRGDEDLADSVNRLLVVGFYLINIGFTTLALRYGARPGDTAEVIEILSTKVGLVLLVLGFMHFLNLYVFSRLRRKSRGFEPGREPPARDAAGVANPVS